MNKSEAEMEHNSVSASFFIGLKPTSDPYVWIEEQRPNYIRYRNSNGRRWEVIGTCDMRGDCLIGSINPLLGPPEGRLDVPVTPEFDTCCGNPVDGTLIFKELEAL